MAHDYCLNSKVHSLIRLSSTIPLCATTRRFMTQLTDQPPGFESPILNAEQDHLQHLVQTMHRSELVGTAMVARAFHVGCSFGYAGLTAKNRLYTSSLATAEFLPRQPPMFCYVRHEALAHSSSSLQSYRVHPSISGSFVSDCSWWPGVS